MDAMLDGLNAAYAMPEPPRLHAVERAPFVDAMRHAATGVTLVTTDGAAGRFGLTVSAMASVSADPPMVLVCVNNTSPAAAAIRENRAFCVSVLGAHQTPVSDVFAGRDKRADRFAGFEWSALETGAPALDGAPAIFDCRLVEHSQFGSHTVFVGLVVAVGGEGGTPLVYQDRAYCRPAPVA